MPIFEDLRPRGQGRPRGLHLWWKPKIFLMQWYLPLLPRDNRYGFIKLRLQNQNHSERTSSSAATINVLVQRPAIVDQAAFLLNCFHQDKHQNSNIRKTPTPGASDCGGRRIYEQYFVGVGSPYRNTFSC